MNKDTGVIVLMGSSRYHEKFIFKNPAVQKLPEMSGHTATSLLTASSIRPRMRASKPMLI